MYRRAGINTCPRPSTFGPTCGVPSYPLPHDERFACYVLNTLLRGGMSSRLFQNIRERQGLAYSVFSELNTDRDIGYLFIYAGTGVEAAPKVVESITKEFRELKERQVSDEELRRAKDHLKGSLILGLESTGSRMSNLARQEMYFGRFFTLDELLLESTEAVATDDVRRITNVFRPKADRAEHFWAIWRISRSAGKIWRTEHLIGTRARTV